MTTKKEFFSSLLTMGFGALFVNASRFISIMIATRFLSVEEIGNYFLVMIVISILSIVASFGTKTSLVKFVAEERDAEKKKSIIFSVFNVYVCLLTIVLFIGLLINHFFPFINISIWIVLFFFSFSVFEYFNIAFQGLKQFRVIAISNTVNAISKAILVILFLAVFKKGFNGLIIALALSNITAVSFQTLKLYKKSRAKEVFNIDMACLKTIAKFSLPLYLNQLYTIFYDKGYSILLAVMLNPSAVAYYNIATRIPSGIEQFRQIYITVFFPTILEFIRDKRSKAIELLQTSMISICIIILTGSAVFYLFKEKIMGLIFSPEYQLCSFAAFIMIVRCFLTFCGPLMGNTLIALGQNTVPLRINFIVTSLSFCVSYFLIPIYGYMAVVYVAISASSLGFTLNWLSLKHFEVVIHIWPFILMSFSAFSLFILTVSQGYIWYALLSGAFFLLILGIKGAEIVRTFLKPIKALKNAS